MGYAPLISKILFSFVLSSTVLYRYGNWFRHRIFVTLIVLLAWYCSFLIIFALPLDVISTVYRQCIDKKDHSIHLVNSTTSAETYSVACEPPSSILPERVFINLWRTVYWSTQFLTWLVMPMMQSYIKAGDFTVKGKLKSALIDNAIYYGSYLLICGVLLIYLALKPGIDMDWDLSLETTRSVYVGLVRSQLEYSTIIWTPFIKFINRYSREYKINPEIL